MNTAECGIPVAEWELPEETSMGPPREHGGMSVVVRAHGFLQKLQWGRRVNTAECYRAIDKAVVEAHTSMGPPREHGGMLEEAVGDLLVDATSMGPPREHGGMLFAQSGEFVSVDFNGAAA